MSNPFPDGHGWEHGVRLGKPASVKGNKVDGLSFRVGNVLVDAPSVVLYTDGQTWAVELQEHVPNPGPGDFRNLWNSPEEAIADILDYFFGDPERMSEFDY
ncbi:MAG: hypothetical protein IAF58_16820 [Leptolyngbya sp.]|nr:hypothetical protein [Candidatus Melainabacteria bacterium]